MQWAHNVWRVLNGNAHATLPIVIMYAREGSVYVQVYDLLSLTSKLSELQDWLIILKKLDKLFH